MQSKWAPISKGQEVPSGTVVMRIWHLFLPLSHAFSSLSSSQSSKCRKEYTTLKLAENTLRINRAGREIKLEILENHRKIA